MIFLHFALLFINYLSCKIHLKALDPENLTAMLVCEYNVKNVYLMLNENIKDKTNYKVVQTIKVNSSANKEFKVKFNLEKTGYYSFSYHPDEVEYFTTKFYYDSESKEISVENKVLNPKKETSDFISKKKTHHINKQKFGDEMSDEEIIMIILICLMILIILMLLMKFICR